MKLVLVRQLPPGLVLQAIGARPVERWESPALYQILDSLCERAGLVLAVAPLSGGLLQLALSRGREGEADLEAAELTGDPHGLASALIKLCRREQMQLRWRFRTKIPSLLRDHWATEQRIQALLAMPQPRDAKAGKKSPLELVGDYPAQAHRAGDARRSPGAPWSPSRGHISRCSRSRRYLDCFEIFCF